VIFIAFFPLLFLNKYLEFSPEKFMNEWLKFFLFSLGWVLIVNEFTKRKKIFDNNKKKNDLIDNIIVKGCDELLLSIKNNNPQRIMDTWSLLKNTISDDYLINFYTIEDVNLLLHLNDFKNMSNDNSKAINSIVNEINSNNTAVNPYKAELKKYINNFKNNILSCK